MTGKPLILREVQISLRSQSVVAIDAGVAPGEVLTVMGPSGSGKSTLMAFTAGLLDRDFKAEGRVILGSSDVTELPPEERRIGLLFQDPMLFPHLSVMGNILFGMRDGADRRQRAAAALAQAGLEGFGPRDPFTLSGGQKARVALLRVLLSDPFALLLDEPFSKLDTALRSEFRSQVFDRIREKRLATILVTHDWQDAEAAGGPVVQLGG